MSEIQSRKRNFADMSWTRFSGAGKTVSAKYIMRYFATVDDPSRPSRRKVKS